MSGFDAAGVARRVLLIEAEALSAMAEGLDGAFARAVETLHAIKGRVVCTGVGKSGHVARKIAATLASTGQPSIFVHATEASHGDLGMTAKADCALGRAADVLLLLPDSAEAAAAVDAPTTSTTLQIALGDALAVALLERRGFTATDFRVFHPGGKLGSALRTVADLMHKGGELPLVAPDASMQEALLVMTEKRFGCVGVVDDDKLAGLITDGDLRRHMEGLLSHKAGEVMTAHPATAQPHMLAGEALKIMNERRITVLFVVDQGRPVGILHVHDVLRAGVL